MFDLRSVAVCVRLVLKLTAPDVIVTPLTVTELTLPELPLESVTEPVAAVFGVPPVMANEPDDKTSVTPATAACVAATASVWLSVPPVLFVAKVDISNGTFVAPVMVTIAPDRVAANPALASIKVFKCSAIPSLLLIPVLTMPSVQSDTKTPL